MSMPSAYAGWIEKLRYYVKDKPAAPPRNVVNLMDALRKSLAQSAPKSPKPKKRAEGQREMLLPISGKGPKQKAPGRPASVRKAG